MDNLESVSIHSQSPFDLIVIGGGIQGAAVLREAALRGKRCLLLEQDDFGARTSAASLKVIHGGLRYLQHLNLKRMRESIRSRRTFQQVMPHLTEPVRFVFPTAGIGVKGRKAFRCALFLNELISWDRNRGVPRWRWIRNGRVVDRHLLQQWFPALELGTNWTGGGVWDEIVLQNTERAIVEFLIDAVDRGAAVANYHRVTRLRPSPRGWRVIAVGPDGDVVEADGRKIAMCTGPDAVRELFDPPLSRPEPELTRSVNLVVRRRLVSDRAIGLESAEAFQDKGAVVQKGRRLFFFVPYGQMTMVGTWYDLVPQGAEDPRAVSFGDVERMVGEVNAISRGLRFGVGDIAYLHVGLLYKEPGSGAGLLPVQPMKETKVAEVAEGVFTFHTVKYTTAPEVARDWARRQLGGPRRISVPVAKPDAEEYPNLHAAFRPLAATYGVRTASKILSISAEKGRWLSIDPAIWSGEITWVVRHEWVRHLDDYVLRRNGFGTQVIPDVVLLERLADAFGEILGWGPEARRAEVARVLKFYWTGPEAAGAVGSSESVSVTGGGGGS